MDETKIPTRDDLPESDKWDLSHLFTSVDKWSEDFALIQTTYPRLTNWKGRVGESATTLAELLEFEKALDLKIERVYHFASLQLAEDSANPDYLARMGQLQNLLTKIGETASFITPEIQAIEDEKFDRYLDDPALKEWRVSLHRIRRMKPHVLSEKEEPLLALGSAALDNYDGAFSRTDVDMKFGALL
jgi:oligoendopeptidase F